MEKLYTQKYQESGPAEYGSGERRFLSFLESLNEVGWEELLRDILNEEPEAYRVLAPDRGQELRAYSYVLIDRLSSSTKRLAAKALERVIGKALAENDLLLLERAVLFAGALPSPAVHSLLQSLVLEAGTPELIREVAADTLAGCSDDVPANFWDKVDLNLHAALAPAMVAALSSRSGLGALRRLSRMHEPPGRMESLHYPLRLAFRTALSNQGGLAAIVELAQSGPPWLTELFDVVFSFGEFRDHLAEWRARSVPSAAPSSEEGGRQWSQLALRNAGKINDREVSVRLHEIRQT